MADSDWESLLDFQYVPGGIISGLTGDQVEIIAQQSIEDGDILRDLDVMDGWINVNVTIYVRSKKHS